MPNNNFPDLSFMRTLNLPRWPVGGNGQSGWYDYLTALFTRVKADDVGQMFSVLHPEIVTALAKLQDQGISIERISGILQGVALMQFLHIQGYLKIEEPPHKEDIVQ